MPRAGAAVLAARIATASNAALVAPASADGHRRHRHAGGHLHDREQRIQPVERLALDGDADHGQEGMAGHHARQVGGAAGAGNDHLQATVFGLTWRTPSSTPACDGRRRRGIRGRRRTGSACRRLPHRLPVGLAAHDDADERPLLIRHCHPWKPLWRCEPSQKGLFAEPPQRQSAVSVPQ